MSLYIPISNQDADLNGASVHLIVKKFEQYVDRAEASGPTLFSVEFEGSSIRFFESVPLTEIELADIEASEQEFARGEAPIFDTIDDLINYLHADDETEEDSTG